MRRGTFVAAGLCTALLVSFVPSLPASASTPAAPTSVSTYVVGGSPVPEGGYPFLALLLVQAGPNSYGEYCGGSLVAESWVMTAAHCVTGDAPARPDAVLIGRMVASDTSAGDFNHADAVYVDPAYDPNLITNDVALIHLARPSPQPEVRLLDESEDGQVVDGASATVIGDGETSPNDPSSQPSQIYAAPQVVQSDATCGSFYGDQYDPVSMLCAGQPGVSPCFGDSGGPLVLGGPGAYVQIGIVSHGPQQCGSAPGVYTRVSDERTWVRNTIAGVPDVAFRTGGADRVATALDVSAESFPTSGSAGAVVLANESSWADALPGTPLSVAKRAPLLLTPGDALDGRVASEITRVLPSGGTVYLLGGPSALSDAVASAVAALGDTTVRLGGSDRFATAAAIADQGLGDPTTVLEATGLDFADALAGGAAAAAAHGAVLLTNGSSQAPETAAYLDAHPPTTRYALGGPASAADPAATSLAGADRYATSVAVAGRFFPGASLVGVANGMAFPDALAGGAQAASLGGPLLLVPPSAPIAPAVLAYLQAQGSGFAHILLYGGPAALSQEVEGELIMFGS